MKSQNITLGILAHVDAGKTTLAETLLLKTGAIRKAGRVDHGDTLLDHNSMERARGITIFSSQAQIHIEGRSFTLLDTPGHVDFSAEMERTLQVLDYAILVISGPDGIQEHVRTLWSLLRTYHVPTFLWINKMDQPGTSREALTSVLRHGLDRNILPWKQENENPQADVLKEPEKKTVFSPSLEEDLAAADDGLLEKYLEGGHVTLGDAQKLVRERKVFPCWFGSALKMEGVDPFISQMSRLCVPADCPDDFGARVFKITRDGKDRLTWMKVTGGTLRVKQTLTTGQGLPGERSALIQETAGKSGCPDTEADTETHGQADGTDARQIGKAEQIRIYAGENAHQVKEAPAGTICAVTGLKDTFSGEGLGFEEGSAAPVLSPVMSYDLQLKEGTDRSKAIRQLRTLEEEFPELHLVADEASHRIRIQLMGDVQIQVLTQMIKERFGLDVSFSQGSIVYRETIANTVEGVGHYEPLRHYAEVHLKMEPLEEGSGLIFTSEVPVDKLDLNWQRLVLTHLQERPIRGVLTGSQVTDMKVTLVAGRAHVKHTEGGDFRQATYRALRQGLMQAENVLLEPVYSFRLEVPAAQVGRAMTDLQNMSAVFGRPEEAGSKEASMAILHGTVPAACVGDYQTVLRSYTGGAGHLSLTMKGFEPCHNTEEVVRQTGYDPDADTEYPSGSIFCSHGAGMYVPWDQVKAYMHLPSVLDEPSGDLPGTAGADQTGAAGPVRGYHALPADIQDDEQLLEIFTRTYGSIKKERAGWKKSRSFGAPSSEAARSWRGKDENRPQALLVDGYNIIFAWEELKQLAKDNLDAARERLIELMANYQGYRRMLLILVFDAYKVAQGEGEIYRYPSANHGDRTAPAGSSLPAGDGRRPSGKAGQADESVQEPGIFIVYTREAETADSYIERCATQMTGKYDITVATSDAAEQVIIWGAGAKRLPAKQFHKEVSETFREIRRDYLQEHPGGKQYLFDNLDADFAAFLEDVRLGRKKMEDLPT